MVWNVFNIELIQKLTPEKFVLMDQGQRLESLVLIGFCNERAGAALGCERAAEHGKTLSCFFLPWKLCPLCPWGFWRGASGDGRGRHRCQDSWWWDLASCQLGPVLCYNQMLWKCFFARDPGLSSLLLSSSCRDLCSPFAFSAPIVEHLANLMFYGSAWLLGTSDSCTNCS